MTSMQIISQLRYGSKAALRDWKRSVWLIFGVALGTAFYVAISTLGNSYTELVKLPFSRIESDLIVQVGTRGKSLPDKLSGAIQLPFSNQPISQKRIETILSLNGIKSLNPTVLLWFQTNKAFATITGIDPGSTSSGPAKAMQWISKGRSVQKSNETVVESHYARFNKLEIDKVVQLDGRDFHIVGITSIKEGASLAAANFYISIQDARELAGMAAGEANLLSVTLKKGIEKAAIQEKIDSLLPGALVSSTDSISDMMKGFAKISGASSNLLSITALVFTILLACWLVSGRQQEQRWQVGLMQTVGWQRKDIILAYGIESLTLTLAGCLLGVCLGLLVSIAMGSFDVSLSLPWNLSPSPDGMQHGRVGQTMQVPLPITFKPADIFFAGTIICLTAVSTGILATARSAGKEVRQTLLEQ